MSDGLPEAYRGKLFFSEWGQRRVSVIDVARDGATFKFVKNDPLLIDAGGDFRPMELYVAADGSLRQRFSLKAACFGLDSRC